MKSIIMYRILAVYLLVFSAVILNCEGPAGPEGQIGPQGEQGPAGPKGEDGNANVIYSEWTELSEENWSEAFNFFSQIRREYPVQESAITENVLYRGIVSVYMRFPDLTEKDVVYALPTILHITKPASQFLGVDLKIGNITIVFYDTDGGADPGLIPSGLAEYRYIIIPGSTAAKANSPDLAEYQSVIDFLGIDY